MEATLFILMGTFYLLASLWLTQWREVVAGLVGLTLLGIGVWRLVTGS